MKMKNIAIILAGGTGNRLNAGIPKQFLKLAGKTILEHTISAFQKNEHIDEIAIISNKDYVHIVEEMVIQNTFTKVTKILNGGKERYESTLAALNAFSEEANLLIHDAVRPLVDNRIINDTIQALEEYEAVDTVVPAIDTIIEVDESHQFIKNIPDRTVLYRGQTPQAFKASTLKKAYSIALRDPNFKTTDDCGVVKKYLPNIKIKTVTGDNRNMKLTYKEDFFLLDKLFQIKGTSFENSHLTDNEIQNINNKIIVVFGGSQGIGKDIADICREAGGKVYTFSRSSTHTDISKQEDVTRALNTVVQKEGKIDWVVNTAAVLHKLPLMNMDYDTINTAIDINYKGAIIVAKEAFPYLKESNGQLLFFTSSSYTKGRMNYSIYSSSKCAIVNLTQALADEWSSFNIKVNCINPERTKTPMRVRNFGIEPEESLLSSKEVALNSIKVLLSDFTGLTVDVKVQKI